MSAVLNRIVTNYLIFAQSCDGQTATRWLTTLELISFNIYLYLITRFDPSIHFSGIQSHAALNDTQDGVKQN